VACACPPPGVPRVPAVRITGVQELLAAAALLLVIEGIWPFLSPATFRRALQTVVAEADGPLRLAGLVSMLAGVALLYVVN